MRTEAHEEALVYFFGEPGPEEELDDEDYVGGDLGCVSVLRSCRTWCGGSVLDPGTGYARDDLESGSGEIGELTVRRLVSKVPKPRDRSCNVRYEVIGVVGVIQVKPSA